jgi:SAM-dependent methyltransferase
MIVLRRRVHNDSIKLECDFAQCNECDHVFLNPQPTPNELKGFYDSNYHVFSNEPRSAVWIDTLLRERLHGDRLNHAQLVRGGRYLDVGCGLGDMVAAMQAAGMDSMGVDPSSIAVEIGNQNGRDLRHGMLHEMQLPSESFDSITMYHSLEHGPVPIETLTECTRLLKRDGILMVAVPNFQSLVHEWLWSGWTHLDPPYHLQHFCERSLALAGERAGLVLREMKTESFVNHIESEFNFWARRKLLLPQRLSGKLNLFRPLARYLYSRAFALNRGDALIAYFARHE